MAVDFTLITEKAVGDTPDPKGIAISPDGTKMIVASLYDYTICRYAFGVAWDLATISLVGSPVTLTSFDRSPRSVFVTPDGSNLFIGAGYSGSYITHYNLSTAWDITTRAFVRRYNYATLLSSRFPFGMYFKDDGSKLFIAASNDSAGLIYEFALGTNWDISTPTLLNSFNLINEVCAGAYSYPRGLWINPDGDKLYTTAHCNFAGNLLCVCTLASAWDISSVTVEYSDAFGSVVSNIGAVYLTPSEDTAYISYNYNYVDTAGYINQYSLVSGLPVKFWTNFNNQREI